jgi:hypothetical protein
MNSTFHLHGMTMSSLRQLFCDTAFPILNILDDSTEEAISEPPVFSEEAYPSSDTLISLFKTRKDIYKKGSVTLTITFSESYFKEAAGESPALSPRGITLSLNADIIKEGKKDWLINTEFISGATPDEIVRKFPLSGCSRTFSSDKWEKLVAFINSLAVVVPHDTVAARVVKEDGTITYNEDIIRRHIEGEFTWAHTREGADGVMASGGRLYWYDQYGGIYSDESYEDFLGRLHPEEKLFGTTGEVSDGNNILRRIRAHILETHPELRELFRELDS